jgi:hypothetical protein
MAAIIKKPAITARIFVRKNQRFTPNPFPGKLPVN